MKKIIIGLFCIAFLTTSLISCERKRNERGDEQSRDYIIMGDSSSVEITIHDTIMRAWPYEEVEYYIDLDNDGIMDVLANIEITGTSHNRKYKSVIECLNASVGFYSPIQIDTTFLILDSTAIWDLDTMVLVFYQTYYNCIRNTVNDSIISVNHTNENIFRASREGSIIKSSDTFITNNLNLFTYHQTHDQILIKESGDTTYYKEDIYECWNYYLPYGETVYLGLKIEDKLGWIKFILHSSFKIEIIYSAIQK